MNLFAFQPIAPPLALAVRQGIEDAEAVMREMPQVEIPLRHGFADGLYGREILIPAGAMLTGKVHRKADLNFVLYGEMAVLTEHGWKHITGPCWFAGKAGAKQAGYAYTECLWVTVHATDNQDLDTLEDEILIPDPLSPHDFVTGRVREDVGWVKTSREDFAWVLADSGFTAEQVEAQVTNEADQIRVDMEGVEIAPSAIHGLGVHALRSFELGERIGPARVDGKRTQLGRYINHATFPNTRMVVVDGGDIALVTTGTVLPGMEITTDYRQSLALVRELSMQEAS